MDKFVFFGFQINSSFPIKIVEVFLSHDFFKAYRNTLRDGMQTTVRNLKRDFSRIYGES